MFYDELGAGSEFNPAKNLQFLIDTHERLIQYQSLAHELNIKMLINIEIDVGLHRGGLDKPEDLAPLLKTIAEDPDHLELSGFMGYDPHVAGAERLSIPIEKAHFDVVDLYAEFVDFLKNNFPDLYSENLCFNGAGSPTYSLYENDSIVNDISTGSALLKPTNFDIGTLDHHVPSMFIATPVLKKMAGVKIPFIGQLDPDAAEPEKPRGVTLFIYGGYWKATPFYPRGLALNDLYGRSTNQEMLNGPADIDVAVDDYVFFRPTQSESVMLQFGDLFVVRSGEAVGRWKVFS